MLRVTLVTALLIVPLAGGARGAEQRPLIGANYSHWGMSGCDFGGTGILYLYPASGVVRRQLAAIRAAGIETLRLLLWHMHDTTGHSWGIVSSAGGRIGGDERANLIRYLEGARATGFKRLTIAFAPEWTNSPLPADDHGYDPSLFDENWGFIRDVRGLAKQHGPPDTRFNLLNAGAPSDDDVLRAQVVDYISRLYGRYVDAFGGEDVTVSTVVNGEADRTRLFNLVSALRKSARPLPRWFELHVFNDAGQALENLRLADATLASEGLAQPMTVGDIAYDDGLFAAALRTFATTSSRPLEEALQWPLRADSPCEQMSVQAPYRADEYITALTGSAPRSTLVAAPSGPVRWVLRSPYGHQVSGLLAGRYTLTVRDRSGVDNFHLTGPGVNRSTPVAGWTNAVWRLVLRKGVYRYRSDARGPGSARTFVVMDAG